MLVLVLLGLVASVSTAPGYEPHKYNNGFQHRMDTFWDNFDRKMDDLHENVENVVKHSKNRELTKIDGNEYQIIINMPGFNNEDIKVKAKKGNLVIQANHDVPGEPNNNYLFVRDLPDYVNENGSWSYNNSELTIGFPIIQKPNPENQNG